MNHTPEPLPPFTRAMLAVMAFVIVLATLLIVLTSCAASAQVINMPAPYTYSLPTTTTVWPTYPATMIPTLAIATPDPNDATLQLGKGDQQSTLGHGRITIGDDPRTQLWISRDGAAHDGTYQDYHASTKPSSTPTKGPTVMDVLGVLFCILLVAGAVFGTITLVSNTVERLKDLERAKAARDAVDLKASRRERVKRILGIAHDRTDDIMNVFD